MPIFKLENGTLKKLHVGSADRERDLQRLLESNLLEALGVHFLATEYTTTMGGRIDTLGVDEAGCPVIIEYKKSRSDNIINQGLSYLRWLRTQKQEFFEKLMADKLGQEAARAIGLDWRNPRVICVAESYSKFDIDTVEVVPLRIDLVRYRYYAGEIFSLDPVNVQAEETSKAPSISKAASDIEERAKPSLESILAAASPKARDLLTELREWILGLDETISENPTIMYVGYRVTNNFAEVHVNREGLKVHLRPVTYDDPLGMVEQVPESHRVTMDRRLYIRSREDLIAAQPLIEQSYRDVL